MNITHVIKTRRITSDGRLLKWIASLRSYGITSKVLVLEDEMVESEIKGSHLEIERIKLSARRLFGQRNGYFLKVPEYCLHTINSLLKDNSDVIVFHDNQQYLNIIIYKILLNKKKKTRVIWDNHELPHSFFSKSMLTRLFIKKTYSSCDFVVFTNKERSDYVKKSLGIQINNFSILGNRTSLDYINQPLQVLPKEIETWLDGEKYILWLGEASIKRNFNTAFKALIPYLNNYKLIILGSVLDDCTELIKPYQQANRVYITFVDQKELINYIDNCLFSIVIYANTSVNNLLCEPNRIYQLMARNKYLIAGNNPPMKRILIDYSRAVVLEDDGSNLKILNTGITEMFKLMEERREVIGKNDLISNFTWENQFEDIYHYLKNDVSSK